MMPAWMVAIKCLAENTVSKRRAEDKKEQIAIGRGAAEAKTAMSLKTPRKKWEAVQPERARRVKSGPGEVLRSPDQQGICKSG